LLAEVSGMALRNLQFCQQGVGEPEHQRFYREVAATPLEWCWISYGFQRNGNPPVITPPNSVIRPCDSAPTTTRPSGRLPANVSGARRERDATRNLFDGACRLTRNLARDRTSGYVREVATTHRPCRMPPVQISSGPPFQGAIPPIPSPRPFCSAPVQFWGGALASLGNRHRVGAVSKGHPSSERARIVNTISQSKSP
jgi:hypothetical protein